MHKENQLNKLRFGDTWAYLAVVALSSSLTGYFVGQRVAYKDAMSLQEVPEGAGALLLEKIGTMNVSIFFGAIFTAYLICAPLYARFKSSGTRSNQQSPTPQVSEQHAGVSKQKVQINWGVAAVLAVVALILIGAFSSQRNPAASNAASESNSESASAPVSTPTPQFHFVDVTGKSKKPGRYDPYEDPKKPEYYLGRPLEFEVTGPDGRKFNVTTPRGKTGYDAIEYLKHSEYPELIGK